MQRINWPELAALAAVVILGACTAAVGSDATQSAAVWRASGEGWRTDPIWHDGLAEKAVYEAELTIYEKPRSYVATAYTNKERVDPRATVKSDTGEIEVFKHHWSERVPTENYDYRFSTSLYTRADDMTAFKLTAATQEDCGASFKLAWRDGGRMRWNDSVYFPGAGQREGELPNAAAVHFVDELALLLRDFPFDAPEERTLQLVPQQKDTHQVSFEPELARVRYVARETLELPAGKLEAHHLALVPDATAKHLRGADYWFAADARAPWLHVLLRYEGPSGARYRLKSIERVAYWKRG